MQPGPHQTLKTPHFRHLRPSWGPFGLRILTTSSPWASPDAKIASLYALAALAAPRLHFPVLHWLHLMLRSCINSAIHPFIHSSIHLVMPASTRTCTYTCIPRPSTPQWKQPVVASQRVECNRPTMLEGGGWDLVIQRRWCTCS